MDKLPVPRHLRDIAGEVKQTAYSVRVKLCCPCGCELFRVEKSTWSEDELRRMEAYEAALKKLVLGYTCRRLPNGQHQRRRNLFGLIPLRWQNFDMTQAPGYWDVQCICVICDACRATHVVFDSRCHGYEGWAAEWPEDTLDWQPPVAKRSPRDRVRDSLSGKLRFRRIPRGEPGTHPGGLLRLVRKYLHPIYRR